MRAAVQFALECLEAGDTAGARFALMSALEDGDPAQPYRCHCGSSYRFPGELDNHRRFAHGIETDAA
jgi:hypothetical protein